MSQDHVQFYVLIRDLDALDHTKHTDLDFSRTGNISRLKKIMLFDDGAYLMRRLHFPL